MFGPSFRTGVLSLALFVASFGTATAQSRDPAPKFKKTLKEHLADINRTTLFQTDGVQKPFNADAHILLVSHFDKNFALSGLAEADPIIVDQGDFFLVRNALENKTDTLWAGRRIYDRHSGYKALFTYDEKNNVIDIHNAGTNAAEKREMKFAGKAIFGFTLPGVQCAPDYLEIGIADLKEKFPEISKDNTTLRFTGHSAGGPIAYAGMMTALSAGYKVDALTLIDPYGMKPMVRRANRTVLRGVEDKVALRETLDAFYQTKCTTMTPRGGSFVDKVPGMAWDFGRVQTVETPDPYQHALTSYVGKYKL